MPTTNNPINNLSNITIDNNTIINPINSEENNLNNINNNNISKSDSSNESTIKVEVPPIIEPSTRRSRRTRGLDIKNKGLSYIGLASNTYLASLIEGNTNLELSNSTFRILNENYYTLNKENNSKLNINLTAFNSTRNTKNNNLSIDKIIIIKPINYITIKELKSDIEALSDYLYKDY